MNTPIFYPYSRPQRPTEPTRTKIEYENVGAIHFNYTEEVKELPVTPPGATHFQVVIALDGDCHSVDSYHINFLSQREVPKPNFDKLMQCYEAALEQYESWIPEWERQHAEWEAQRFANARAAREAMYEKLKEEFGGA